jgi:dimethylhistidine N-methyltransferase
MRSECFCQDLIDGLRAGQAAVPPKYLYDDLGCRLFELITHLPEYYPTRTELSLMARHAGDIREAAGTGGALVDLGAGNCQKARSLFPTLKPQRYVAIDISADFLHQALAPMHRAFPEIEMFAVGADLCGSLELPSALNGMRRVFFFPGSSIGNLDPEEALALLSRIRAQCVERSGLLIGIDLVKQPHILHAAYNDALGITAAFNRNVLNHINTLIDGDFRLEDWRHRAVYDECLQRIEMHLDATKDIAVTWHDGARRFKAGESIHTENSYKYRLADFTAMLAQAGFGDICAWTDERQWFAVCYGSV